MESTKESEIIANVRVSQGTTYEEDVELVFALVSNRKIFDALCENEEKFTNLRNAIRDVLISGQGLMSWEIRNALADYDRIMGNNDSELKFKIDKLQAELNSLRATLRNA